MSFTEKSMEMVLSDDIKQNQKRNIKFLQDTSCFNNFFKKNSLNSRLKTKLHINEVCYVLMHTFFI